MEAEQFIARHKVLDYPEYCFELDEYRRGQDTFLLAHIRVHKWSPSVFKRILTQWKVFRACVTAPLFATAETDDDKWASFVGHLGFRFLKNVVCDNGDQRRLFIHAVQPRGSNNCDHRWLPANNPPPPPKTPRRRRRRGPRKRAH